MSRGGVIRLLDQIKTYPFPNFSSWQILATLDKSSNLNPIQASMQSYERETESLPSHLGETEIPIGRTDLLGFGNGYDK